jgi:hypothetical protein
MTSQKRKKEDIDRCNKCNYLFEYKGVVRWEKCPCGNTQADITENYIRLLFNIYP